MRLNLSLAPSVMVRRVSEPAPLSQGAVDHFGETAARELATHFGSTAPPHPEAALNALVMRCAPEPLQPTAHEVAAVASMSGFSAAGAVRVLAMRERLVALRRAGLLPSAAVRTMNQDLRSPRGYGRGHVALRGAQPHHERSSRPSAVVWTPLVLGGGGSGGSFKRPRADDGIREEAHVPTPLKSARLSFGSVFDAEQASGEGPYPPQLPVLTAGATAVRGVDRGLGWGGDDEGVRGDGEPMLVDDDLLDDLEEEEDDEDDGGPDAFGGDGDDPHEDEGGHSLHQNLHEPFAAMLSRFFPAVDFAGSGGDNSSDSSDGGVGAVMESVLKRRRSGEGNE